MSGESDNFDSIMSCAAQNDAPGIRALVAKGCSPNFANAAQQSALHVGSLWGNVNVVNTLLELRANPCAQNKRLATPLHVAVIGRGPLQGRADCIRLLLELKADPEIVDHRGDKAVDLADDDEIRLALGDIPLILHQMVGTKKATRVEQVINRVQAGQLPGLTLDKKDAAGLTALHYSVHIAWHKGVEMLGDAGASVCTQAQDGETPLHLAVQRGHIETIKKLMELKANPNVKDQDKDADPRYASKSFDLNPEEHRTPLHYAAELCNLTAIQFLLEAQADPNALDSKMLSPLCLAMQDRSDKGFEPGNGVRVVGTKVADLNDCLGSVIGEMVAGNDACPRWPVQVNGNFEKNYLLKEENLQGLADETLAMLLGARADVNLGMGQARTGLHQASRHGDTSVVSLMLEARALLDQQDKSGFSALHNAARSKHSNVVKILVTARAALDLKTGSGKTAAELAINNGCEPSILALLRGQKAETDVTEDVALASHGGYLEGATMGDLTAEQRAALFIY